MLPGPFFMQAVLSLLGIRVADPFTDGGADAEEIARRREAWRDSAERRQWHVGLAAGYSTALVLGLVVGAVISWSVRHHSLTQGDIQTHDYSFWSLVWPGLLIGGIAAVVLATPALAGYEITLQRAVVDRLILGAAKEELAEAEAHVADVGDDATLNLAAIWKATQLRLDYYHEIALSQSRRSFGLGQAAAVGGFMVLLGGAVVAAFSRHTTGAVVAGSLGAVGAALSAFISSTFARSQDAATRQLRAYFAQPLHLSRVLIAERLVGQVAPEQRADVITEIVRGVFQARDNDEPSDAQ